MKRKKTLLVIGAGLEQSIAISIAQKMGLRVIAVDGNKKAVGLKIADTGIYCDIRNERKLEEIAKKYNVSGAVTHAVEISEVVAKLAKNLGLPGLDPKIANLATNKLLRARVFKKNSIAYPKFGSAKTTTQARVKAKKIGYPVVIKPVDNSAARGVKKIFNDSELIKSFKETLNYSKSKTILIEEFLDGHQISTESFVYKEKIITTGFADRNYSRLKEFEPYFIEDGHTIPSVLLKKLQNKVIREVEKAIKALGINWGAAKSDVLICNDKIYILEMAARTSGGWFATGTVPIATGVNILKPLIKLSIGKMPSLNDFKTTKGSFACQRYIIPTESGFFDKIIGIERAKKMPGVRMLDIFNLPKKGTIIYKARNHADRIGHIIAEGKTKEDAYIKCSNAINQISLNLKQSAIK